MQLEPPKILVLQENMQNQEGRKKFTEIYTEGVRPSASAEVPGLTRASLRRLEGKDPVPAALASIVSSIPPSEATPTPRVAVTNAKVKAWRRAARKGKEKDAPLGTMFEATWGEETFEIRHGEMDWSASAQSSEWEPDWVSQEPPPPEEPKQRECLKLGPSPRLVAPEPTCVDRGLPPRNAAPEVGLDETMDMLSRVLGAGDEDPNLNALSASLKTKLELRDLKNPPPTNPWCGTFDQGCEKLQRYPPLLMNTCPSPFHPRVRTVPVQYPGHQTHIPM